MTLEELSEILSNIKYKSNFKISKPIININGGYNIKVRMEVPDRTNKESIPIDLYIHLGEKMLNELFIVNTIRNCFQAMETHECDELFLYKGIRLYDPHKNEKTI